MRKWFKLAQENKNKQTNEQTKKSSMRRRKHTSNVLAVQAKERRSSESSQLVLDDADAESLEVVCAAIGRRKV
jgi:hypothetical protein